jgi:transcriptional regulator with XRE-family HTH domain
MTQSSIDEVSDFSKALGERIRDARKHMLLNQKDLANVVGVTRVTMSRYETGRMCPSADVLARICTGLDVSADWLMFGMCLDSPMCLDGPSRRELWHAKWCIDRLTARLVPGGALKEEPGL